MIKKNDENIGTNERKKSRLTIKGDLKTSGQTTDSGSPFLSYRLVFLEGVMQIDLKSYYMAMACSFPAENLFTKWIGINCKCCAVNVWRDEWHNWTRSRFQRWQTCLTAMTPHYIAHLHRFLFVLRTCLRNLTIEKHSMNECYFVGSSPFGRHSKISFQKDFFTPHRHFDLFPPCDFDIITCQIYTFRKQKQKKNCVSFERTWTLYLTN